MAVGVAASGAGCSSSSCGTDAGAGGANAMAAAIGCLDPEPGVLDYLDDMEDGNPYILARDGRIGSWYTYHDATSGTLNPNMDVPPIMEAIPGGRCSATASTHAMRVTGSGFSDWGAGFGFDLRYMALPSGLPGQGQYDASRFSGITFWARVGDTSISSVRVGIGDDWSRPDGGHCTIELSGGPTACYDVFGQEVTLSTTWKRVTLKFGQLSQRAFGLLRPALNTAALMDFEFGIPPGSPAFDIWIDDIAFVQ